MKSRSVVRVVVSQRWSKYAIRTNVGIPGRLTPQGIEDISPNIEEVVDPHTNKDEAIGIDDDDGTDLIDDRSMQQMDRPIRITPKIANDLVLRMDVPDAWILKQAPIVPTHTTMTIVDS